MVFLDEMAAAADAAVARLPQDHAAVPALWLFEARNLTAGPCQGPGHNIDVAVVRPPSRHLAVGAKEISDMAATA